MLADDPLWKDKAQQVASLARDVSEVHARGRSRERDRAAAHSGVSFGLFDAARQQVIEQPKKLLRDAGFIVQGCARGPHLLRLGGHLPGAAARLSAPPARSQGRQLESLRPDIIAAGNFGCIGNIADGTGIPMHIPSNCSIGRPAGPRPAALL